MELIKRKIYAEKISDQVLKLGLSSLAVLCAVTDATVNYLLSFPDRQDSFKKSWDRLMNHRSKSAKEYFEELKDVTGFNLRVILHRLEKKGLIVRNQRDYKPTPNGLKLLEKIKDRTVQLSNWDGRWRLATFDIPEKRKRDRNWLRYILILNGYKSMQKSVFVGKLALPEEIFREMHNRKLNKYVKLLTIGEIDEEELISG